MSEFLQGLKRTAMCGTFRKENAGETAVVMGWVQRSRNLGSIIFTDLRDRSGIVQIVFDETVEKEVFEKAEKIRSEYVLAVKGVVRERSAKTNKIPTGDVEILAEELKILSEAETTPFEILDDTGVNENLRLKYRYLDLRRPSLQKNLITRSEIAVTTRNYLAENGFLEIETPYLGKSTPEGARDYLVPSRTRPGSFYALPQSPQLYKQLLMIAGYDRYFQIAKCFRDEDLRANRQPEFTQIDLEMSFVEDETDVMYPVEGLIKKVFKNTIGLDLGEEHFRTMTWQEAMTRFGSDKPDTRFGLELQDVTDVLRESGFAVFKSAVEAGGSVRLINAKGLAGALTRKEIDKLVDVAKTYGAKGLAYTRLTADGVTSSFEKFLSEEEKAALHKAAGAETGDVLLVVADAKNSTVFAALGALRLAVANKCGLIDPDKFNFLWVTDFPFFEYSEEEGRWMAMHHPFTMPRAEDLDKVESDPGSVRALAYDMVLNGCELGGGSIRINDPAVQDRMLKALGFSEERARESFGFLMDAYQYGAPPHGGMAFGFDRMVMLMLKRDSIRDVIAFPKVQNAGEPMSGCPETVEEKQLRELSIAYAPIETEE